MKTIDIQIQEQPIEFMRKLWKVCLKNDETFHFVNWGNMKWQGRKFVGQTILLRVDDSQVKPIEKYLKEYYGIKYEVYDYPFPDRKHHVKRFGLGKKSIEAKYPEIFHQIYHLYSVLSLKMEKSDDRMKALMQLLHIPLNVYALSFVGETYLYQNMANEKLKILVDIEKEYGK